MDFVNPLTLTPLTAPSRVRLITLVGTIAGVSRGAKVTPTEPDGTIRSPTEKCGRAKESPTEPSSSALPFAPALEPVAEFASTIG